MSRIVFESERPLTQVDPARADIACFVGLVRCNTGAALPAAVLEWLKAQGWTDGPFATRQITPPLDVPIPIETYPSFTALFDAGGSSVSFGTDYLATAVRSFFAQGGKRCYVVRMGDPVTTTDSDRTKSAKLQSLLPSNTFAVDDQSGWHGVGHLAGLPDVSYVALPDLPILTASAATGAVGQTPANPVGPEVFVECSTKDVTAVPPPQYGPFAPRLLPGDYAKWTAAVQAVVQYLSQGSLRELQFVAAFPMPRDTDIAEAQEDPSNALTQDIHDVIDKYLPEPPNGGTWQDIGGVSSAFLQLAYPWLRTTGSYVLLEGLEPPDGALIGLLARNALTRGAFTSATKVTPAEIYDVFPILPARETRVSTTPLKWGDNSLKPMIERFSLFGFTPAGLALLSDVTAFAGESYRPARVHRLVSVILRAARTFGQDVVFQQNGPALWARAQSYLKNLMTRLWQANALDGATAAAAFSVRCDRSTMTQNDLDNGRLIALVTFNAASTIELIRVTLALETSGTSAQSIAQLAEAS